MRDINSAFFSRLQDSNNSINIVELIELQGRTNTWRWTTGNKTVVSSGNSYVPFPGRNEQGMEEGIDLNISVVGFVLSNSGGAFNELLDSNQLDFADITVRRVFVDTPDLGSMIHFTGKLGDYSYDRREISGEARNLFNSANVQWPYYTYMDQCAWRFGSEGCGVDTSSITIGVTTILSASRISLVTQTGSLSGYGNGYFLKGKATFTNGQNSGEVRSIRAHTGDLLAFSHDLPYDISSGDTLDIYPGCRKRLIEDCTSKYDNSSNFLGFPWIPRQEQAI